MVDLIIHRFFMGLAYLLGPKTAMFVAVAVPLVCGVGCALFSISTFPKEDGRAVVGFMIGLITATLGSMSCHDGMAKLVRQIDYTKLGK